MVSGTGKVVGARKPPQEVWHESLRWRGRRLGVLALPSRLCRWGTSSAGDGTRPVNAKRNRSLVVLGFASCLTPKVSQVLPTQPGGHWLRSSLLQCSTRDCKEYLVVIWDAQHHRWGTTRTRKKERAQRAAVSKAEANGSMGSNYKPPKPAPGPPFLPETFASSVTQSETAGYLLTHTALQIRSAEVSLPFYLGMLGMTLIFALNAGPFTAYYLGYPQEGDKATGEIAATTGFRRGLLELIEVHDADGKEVRKP